jgi:hypothetical protein
VVTHGRSTIALSDIELEILLDALWMAQTHEARMRPRRAKAYDELRKRLLKLDLVAKGWGPAQEALADLLPEST